MTVAVDALPGSAAEESGGPPDGVDQPVAVDQPVELWSTDALRSAMQDGDITAWQQIVLALKRDPYGRTARQVEEVLEGQPAQGIAKALLEVLTRTRTHLEANERAEVARHVRLLIQRCGLDRAEFASRVGVPETDLSDYLSGTVSPPASLMIRMRRLSDRFVKINADGASGDS